MKKTILLLLMPFTISAAFSQEKVVADKIAGIVGDKIILKSEIYTANMDIVRPKTTVYCSTDS